MEEKAIIFIDGNNFYHGMKDLGLSSGMKLDYGKFSRKLVRSGEWAETRYYIGQVKQEGDKTRYINQRKFFNFLRRFERVSYHTGRVESRSARNTALDRWIKGLDKRTDLVVPQNILEELRAIADKKPIKYVEKAVDVMIAIDMVSMAYSGDYDVAYLLSADGDFTPAIKKVQDAGKKVFVATSMSANQLKQVADEFIPLNADFFDDCWR